MQNKEAHSRLKINKLLEQAGWVLVDGNKQLIAIYEGKVKEVIEKIWEG